MTDSLPPTRDIPNVVVGALVAATVGMIAFTIWIFTSSPSDSSVGPSIATGEPPATVSSPIADQTGCQVALYELDKAGGAFTKYGNAEITSEDMARALKEVARKLEDQASLASGPVLLSLQRTSSGYAKMRVSLVETGTLGSDSLVDSTIAASRALKASCGS